MKERLDHYWLSSDLVLSIAYSYASYPPLIWFIVSAIPPRSPSWTWYAVLVFLFVIFICIILLGLFLMGRHLKVEPAATTATAGKNAIPAGHGTVRTYCDAGAGEEDNENYDLGYLIKYLDSERAIGKINLEHGQENAGIREYKDQGIPPTDNLQFDLRELRRYE